MENNIADINSPINGNNLGNDMNNIPENDSNKKGRVSGAGAYTKEENLSLLKAMQDHCQAYDAGESTHEFKSYFSKIIEKDHSYSRSRDAVHSHHTELKSTLKKAIKDLSPTGIKLPTLDLYLAEKNSNAVDKSSTTYIEALLGLILTDPKKYNSNKWWSFDVIDLLLEMHLKSQNSHIGGGSGVQNITTMNQMSKNEQGKFAQEEAARQAMMKQRKEEEAKEKEDLTNDRKRMCASSERMADTMEKLITSDKDFNDLKSKVENISDGQAEIKNQMAIMRAENKDSLTAILAALQPQNKT